jgi:hypothetical protein
MKRLAPRTLALLLVSFLSLAIAPLSPGQDNAAPATPGTNAAPEPAALTPAPTPAPAPAANAAPMVSGGITIIKGPGDLAPTTKAFVHPGIYYSASDLDFMRKKLAAHAEPWASAWEKNKPTPRDDGWTPHAVADWDATKDFYMGGDPVVAHREALAWAITGNQANADVAIKILNAWSSTLQTIIPHPAMPQEKLSTGCDAAQFCNAAELLLHGGPNGKSSGWSDADVQKFKSMLQIQYATMKGFFPGYNGNWDLIIMDSVISMGVFLDDPKMFDEALQEYIVGQKPNGGIINYVFPSGQCQESPRDQGHVQWGLGNAVAVCEVAWKQGVDIYGAYDNRLLTGLEYTAKYNLGNDVPFEPTGKATAISPKGRGQFAYIWEAPYQHYVIRRGLEMPYTKQILESTSVKAGFGKTDAPYRPEDTYVVGINWGTFTMYKGAEDPQAAKK